MTRLIEAYLAGFEDWWCDAFKDTAFCVARFISDRAKCAQKFVYENEFAYARKQANTPIHQSLLHGGQ